MSSSRIVDLANAVTRRPALIWLALAYLGYQLIALVDAFVSYQLSIYSFTSSSETPDYNIFNANAVLFMAMLVGFALIALWRGRKSGLILAALIAMAYLYRSVLLDVFGVGEVTNFDADGNVSTAFLDVYGHRLYQALLVVLATAPIWSKASRKYVSW